ncbi:hypothetical protein CDAR_549841 [Caerostris darwini]|uniref:Uncharacterized protein n=1 Tax=Caerostris darwini TaxID=1538125 RepID=A0AAV4V3Q0_9ARAC|nr:hypothetical protein CDAR_549841 [Caerostris darwini]
MPEHFSHTLLVSSKSLLASGWRDHRSLQKRRRLACTQKGQSEYSCDSPSAMDNDLVPLGDLEEWRHRWSAWWHSLKGSWPSNSRGQTWKTKKLNKY